MRKVIQPASLIVVFQTLLSSAATTVDEEKGNPSWQAQALFYVICILSSLPWGGAELAELLIQLVTVLKFLSSLQQVPDEIERVLVGIPAYLSIRKHSSSSGLNIFYNGESENSLAEKFWFVFVVCGFLRISLRIYGIEHSLWLPMDGNLIVISTWPPGLFTFPGEGMVYHFFFEYLMAETLFSQILLLPHPPFKTLYYTLVIMDLCKALPGAFPAVVAGAVRALFEKISDLDMESRTRLILWFSHHLSNFQFIWPWEEWAYVLDLPKWAPKRVFVQDVLPREVRLSHWDKIKQRVKRKQKNMNCQLNINVAQKQRVMAAQCHKTKPTTKPIQMVNRDKEAVAISATNRTQRGSSKSTERQTKTETCNLIAQRDNYCFFVSIHHLNGLRSGLRLMALGCHNPLFLSYVNTELNRKVKEKQSARDMMSWIEETIYPVHGFEVTLTVVAQTLLDIGSKSFTHLVTFLERYGQVFVKLCTDNDKQVMLLSQILGNALNKTYNRISDLRKEISSNKKNVLVAEKASANARVELEAAESKLLLVEGEPVLGDNPLKMKRLRTTVEKTGESLETKETLLNRALSETEVLLLQMFQSFSAVLKERLPEPTKARSLQDLNSTGAEDENSSAMEVDSENGNPKKGSENGERQQWCLSTLGCLTAFTRQYAKEIWPHMEKLESEVFSGDDVHPLFLQAIFSALQVPFTINSYRFIREQRRELAHLFCIF
ncbi:hypothetical protein F2Q69_00040340 [Brassica cretica]|uniref:MIF4G domain-containing protein n=1 Tax=Brassica cretica TaxID=69181 RepID=A0A8S9NS07_BRACR|nr:hypothetical protein F2Q69_00040340 [Brassica cretica]